MPVLSKQRPPCISSVLHCHYYAKRPAFIFEEFRKLEKNSKKKIAAQTVGMSETSLRMAGQQRGTVNGSFVTLRSKKLLIQHRAGH